MTLDLDELERKAKWQRDECTAPFTGPDPDDVLALIERVRDAEAEKAADAERAEYWRVEANRVHAEALAKANERIQHLERAIRLNADAFDESDLRRLGVTEDA